MIISSQSNNNEPETDFVFIDTMQAIHKKCWAYSMGDKEEFKNTVEYVSGM